MPDIDETVMMRPSAIGFRIRRKSIARKAQERAARIERLRAYPILGRGLDDAGPAPRRQERAAGDAGEHCDRTELRLDRVEQRLDRALVHDIDVKGRVPAAGQRAGGAACFGNIQIGQRDRVSVARQRARGGFANAAAGAGNDCNPFH
jgi:hypothetical protein